MGDPPAVSMAANVAIDNAERVSDHLFHQFEQQSEFCDVTIHYGQGDDTKQIRAHWCVLAQSPYFKSQWPFNQQRPDKVQVNRCDAETVEIAIKFLYTGKVSLDGRIVRDVIQVAMVCEIEKLTDMCEQYLRETDVCVHNCIDILDITMSCKSILRDRILTFVLSNLINVIDTPGNSDKITNQMINLIVARALVKGIRRDVIVNFCQRWASADVTNTTCLIHGCHSDGHSHDTDCDADSDRILRLGDYSVGSDKRISSGIVQARPELSPRLIPQRASSSKENPIDIVFVVANTKKADERFCRTQKLFAYMVRDDRWAAVADCPYSCYGNSVLCVDINGHTLFRLVNTSFSTIYCGDKIPVNLNKFDLSSESWSELKVHLRTPVCRKVVIENMVAINNQLFFIATEKSSDSPKSVLLFTCCDYEDYDYNMLFKIKPRAHKLKYINTVVVDERYLVVMCVILHVNDNMKETKIAIWDLITCEIKYVKDTQQRHVNDSGVEEMTELIFATKKGAVLAGPNRSSYRLIDVENGTISIIEGNIMPNGWLPAVGSNDFSRVTSSMYDIQCGSGHNCVPVLDCNASCQTLNVFDFETREWCSAPSLPHDIVHCKPVHTKLSTSLPTLKYHIAKCKHN